jgi:hypothetical protein
LKASPPIPTLEEFLACCDAACEFLVHEYGFVRMATPMEYNPYSVRYRKGELGVDVYGESWGETAACHLVRGEDRLSPGLLVPAAQRPAPRRKEVRRGQLAEVEAIAELLQRHAADFLGGDCRHFDSVLKEWKRITRPRPMTEAHRLERERQQAFTAAGHASRKGDHAEVVRRLEPHESSLSPHQRHMLEIARAQLGSEKR